MKRSEKQLLDHLSSDVTGSNDSIEHIKDSMGSLKYSAGNPLTKTEISLQVTKNYFNDGVQILPAALPVNLQTIIPSFVFGLTDFYSGFAKGLDTNPPSGWTFLNGQGQQLGNEMTVVGGVNWFQLAFWNAIVGASWVWGFPFLRSNGIPPAEPRIVRNNFWQPGHRYRISFDVDNTPNTFIDSLFAPNDGVFVPFIPINHDTFRVEYDYTPTTANLSLTAINGFACDILNLSIREITGYENFIGESSVGIYGFNKNVVFSNNVRRGDLVMTFSANNYPAANLYTCEVIVHCNNIAYGTFLNSFVSDLITINTLRYSVPIAFINQFVNPVTFIYQTLFGKTNTADIDPRNYITNTDFQQQICDLPLTLPIDKNITLNIPMNFDCTNYTLLLFVEKVDALTNIPLKLK